MAEPVRGSGAQGGWVEKSKRHSLEAPTAPIRACGATSYMRSHPSDPLWSRPKGLDHTEGPRVSCFVVYLKVSGMTGLGSAWAMAKQMLRE